MSVLKLPIVGGNYKDTSRTIGLQTCINLYPELTRKSQKSAGALIAAPSMSTVFDLNKIDKCRGFKTLSDGCVYAVYGNKLYKIDDKPEVVNAATVDGIKPVSIAENNLLACFVTDGAVFTLNMKTGEWLNFGQQLGFEVDDVVTLSQRFIVNKRGTGQVYWSDVLSTNIDPLSYATAESHPDSVTALKVHQRTVWVFGELTTEIWYATGDNDAPFVPMQGAGINYGCKHRQTIQTFNNALVWLAQTENGDRQIVISQGAQVAPISDHALDKELQHYDLTDSIAYTYNHEGHSFYVINFPAENKTWAYDGATGFWHQRSIFKDDFFDSHPAVYHAMWRGKHLFAHANEIIVMTLGSNNLDVIGENVYPQVRERTIHAVERTKGMVRHNRLTLVAEQATSQSEADPQVMLSWSDDDGASWSDTRWRGLGKKGEYSKRTFWTRLGASRNRAYRFRITDAAKLIITGAELELK